MTTKPTSAPWADEPYELLSSARLNKHKNAHGAHRSTLEMVHVHNCLLRCLNSISQQGPYVPDASLGNYNSDDVRDLLLFTEAWAKATEHHHHIEETVFFPALQKVAGVPAGLFDTPRDQHVEIERNLAEILKYATGMANRTAEYRWEKLKSLIDALAPVLHRHFSEEIDVLLKLEVCESEAIEQCFKETQKAATADANLEMLYNVFPILLGSSDKTYEGGNTFPSLPWGMDYAINYWFSRRRKGAWRFCPCDFWGQPRELVMLPKGIVS